MCEEQVIQIYLRLNSIWIVLSHYINVNSFLSGRGSCMVLDTAFTETMTQEQNSLRNWLMKCSPLLERILSSRYFRLLYDLLLDGLLKMYGF